MISMLGMRNCKQGIKIKMELQLLGRFQHYLSESQHIISGAPQFGQVVKVLAQQSFDAPI